VRCVQEPCSGVEHTELPTPRRVAGAGPSRICGPRLRRAPPIYPADMRHRPPPSAGAPGCREIAPTSRHLAQPKPSKPDGEVRPWTRDAPSAPVESKVHPKRRYERFAVFEETAAGCGSLLPDAPPARRVSPVRVLANRRAPPRNKTPARPSSPRSRFAVRFRWFVEAGCPGAGAGYSSR